jgi:hypothetical protein
MTVGPPFANIPPHERIRTANPGRVSSVKYDFGPPKADHAARSGEGIRGVARTDQVALSEIHSGGACRRACAGPVQRRPDPAPDALQRRLIPPSGVSLVTCRHADRLGDAASSLARAEPRPRARPSLRRWYAEGNVGPFTAA